MKALALLPLVALCGCAQWASLFVDVAQLTRDGEDCDAAIEADDKAGDSAPQIIQDPAVDAACVAAAKDLGLTVADAIVDALAASRSTSKAANDARAMKAARK